MCVCVHDNTMDGRFDRTNLFAGEASPIRRAYIDTTEHRFGYSKIESSFLLCVFLLLRLIHGMGVREPNINHIHINISI